MLASQGIEPARLGVPRLDGGPVETDSRKIWRTFCENWKLFRGTPSRYWLEHELVEVFGVDLVPSAETADAIYDQIAACVADPGFRPRALLDRFNIEVISTTDPATSDLQHHAKLAADGLGERVLPTFRPDAVVYLDRPTWRADIAELAKISGIDTTTYDGFLDALRSRRAAFVEAGARATDHGHLLADTTPMEVERGPRALLRVLDGAEATQAEVDAFAAEHALPDGRDVLRGRPGDADPPRRAARPQHRGAAQTYGQDKGYDIPVQTEFTRALRPMLDRFGTDPRFRVILFTVDETVYQPRAGPDRRHLPLGSAGRPVVVPRLTRGHAPVPGVRHRDRRLLQHLRLRRRHPGLRVHPRSPRSVSSRRRRLSRPAGAGASAQRGRGRRDGRRPGLQPAQGVLRALADPDGTASSAACPADCCVTSVARRAERDHFELTGDAFQDSQTPKSHARRGYCAYGANGARCLTKWSAMIW